MIKNLVLKEFLIHLRSYKLYPLSLILIGLFIFNGIYFSYRFEEAKNYYDRQIAYGGLDQAANRYYYLSPAPTTFACSANNKQETMLFWIQIEGFDLWQNNSEKGNAFLPVVQALDWTFIIQIFYSLLMLILSYNSISEELENRTLALVSANAVSRWQLFLTKFLSMFLIAATILLAAMLSGLVIILLLNKIPLDVLIFGRLLLFYFLTLLYGALFLLIGMVCSVFTRQSTISLIFALSSWLFLTVIYPQGIKIIVKRTQTGPSNFELEQQRHLNKNELHIGLNELEKKIESKAHYSEAEKKQVIEEALQEIKRLDRQYGPKGQQFMQYWLNLKEQQCLEQRRWQQLSPHILFREIAERVLYSGNFRFFDFLHQVMEFCIHFQEDMQRQVDFSKRYPSAIRPKINGERTRISPPWPQFKDNGMQLEATEPPLLASLAAGLRGILALLLVVAGIGIWGFVGFVRCDIR